MISVLMSTLLGSISINGSTGCGPGSEFNLAEFHDGIDQILDIQAGKESTAENEAPSIQTRQQCLMNCDKKYYKARSDAERAFQDAKDSCWIALYERLNQIPQGELPYQCRGKRDFQLSECLRKRCQTPFNGVACEIYDDANADFEECQARAGEHFNERIKNLRKAYATCKANCRIIYPAASLYQEQIAEVTLLLNLIGLSDLEISNYLVNITTPQEGCFANSN